MMRSHKIRLKTTLRQQRYFRQACGIARFTWNWALGTWQERYKQGHKVTGFELKKEFNALKKSDFPWIYEVTKYASQQPFIHVQKAFVAFFNKQSAYPKFKKKGVHDSFYIGGDQIKMEGKKVKIPLLGWVKLRESLRFDGKIQGATVSQTAGKWFISFNVETDQRPTPCESQAKVGVDLGVKALATLSTGEKIEGSKPLKKYLLKLKRLQRSLAKKTLGSKNREKAKKAVANHHFKISCIRNDSLHKLTTRLTSDYQYIGIEDLDVSRMLRRSSFARAISDMGFFEFKRQLLYKAELRGNIVTQAEKWYPSSKTCSSCGNVKEELSLSERVYSCHYCGNKMDRDLNAALCLEKLISTESSSGIYACGQDGSARMHMHSCNQLG